MSKWKTKNRHIYLLQYHLILVCKYRKKLLSQIQLSEDIKELSRKILEKHDVIIKYMETDKNHIHYMLELNPNISVSKVIKLLKSYITFHIWKKYYKFLSKHFWKEKTFWTDDYFICTVGNVSEKSVKRVQEKIRGEDFMLKAYKYRIYPNKKQEILINKTLGCMRFVYNSILSYKIDSYKNEGKFLSKIDCNNYCNRGLKMIIFF